MDAKHFQSSLDKPSPLCSHALTVKSLTDPYLRAMLHSHTRVPKEFIALCIDPALALEELQGDV